MNIMTYEETINYIHSVSWMGSRPGLERITELCRRLGDRQNTLRVIHVAGTNGKGSFCSMLTGILLKAGYSVGTFTSPYVVSFNERIQLNGEMISGEDLACVTSRVRPIADSMEDHPTEFELITAIGIEYFADKKPDFVILEAGMGGRYDSTNVIESSELSVITGVDLDHTAILGDTVEKIAWEKAGIVKKGGRVLFGSGTDSVKEVILTECEGKGATLYTVDYNKIGNCIYSAKGTSFAYGDKEYKLSLLGEYQTRNAAVVLSAVDALRDGGVEIPESAVEAGLSSARWSARFEIVSKNPLAVYDGAHNPEGVVAAVRNIELFFGKERPLAVVGVMADKDHSVMTESISKVVSGVYCVTPDNPRAMNSEALAREFSACGVPAQAFETVDGGVEIAFKTALVENVPVVLLGSLYMYAEAAEAVKKYTLDGKEV